MATWRLVDENLNWKNLDSAFDLFDGRPFQIIEFKLQRYYVIYISIQFWWYQAFDRPAD